MFAHERTCIEHVALVCGEEGQEVGAVLHHVLCCHVSRSLVLTLSQHTTGSE